MSDPDAALASLQREIEERLAAAIAVEAEERSRSVVAITEKLKQMATMFESDASNLNAVAGLVKVVIDRVESLADYTTDLEARVARLEQAESTDPD